MDAITDPRQAGERLLTYAREGRLRRTVWRAEVEGRKVACLLGAAAGITDAKECPASLMPRWVALALPLLFDGQSGAHAQTFARRWGEAMVRDEWRRIDWDAVRGEWMVFIVQQAKDADALYSSYAALFAARSADHAASHAGDAADAASYAAAAAAHAAAAARESFWTRLATTLCDLIDAELENAK